MAVTNVLRGFFDARGRPIVGLQLTSGEYVSAQVDTGFNGWLLFSHIHAIGLGIGLPLFYDTQVTAAGGNELDAGPLEVSIYWFGEIRSGQAIVTAPPKPGSVRRISRDEQEPLALIGTQLLRGCHLSMNFWSGVHFPVKIRKLRPRST
ncbi:hypothetical protein A2943_01665 [Candidatus Adlerbacteria bacterium RIFCSPLOWO2_01_FULL_51_16]|uniref:Clan AA aspartic protease n=1 Tax=Candidatus Adlerbacteria bacterium RIFCSPLOWO2_01_FULL_51_16 TaxID=1797243 RepID=A0A1F4XEH0_9BACT|nr:MAG: hypothetical protein A2943_01665 [Candidatus Adlerbacteria bacterium RIFCSPLOWO2_01_FULL_51_16]